MAELEHIVYLMLENRSLDNVLGWLYEPGEAHRVVTRQPPVDPVPPDHFDGCLDIDADERERFVTKGTGGRHHVPRFDPHEVYHHVNNQLFETQDTPVQGVPPTMAGFVDDYAKWFRRPEQIKRTFTPDDLPVLNGLAKHFAVSDRYFSSVPTQTNTNRAFAAAGNSLGHADNGALHAWVDNRGSGTLRLGRPGGPQFCQPTMWNVLAELFPVLADELRSRFEGIDIVDYSEFGNLHGADEKERVGRLPDDLRTRGIDAVVSGMGC